MKDRWEAVYQEKQPASVSWYQPRLGLSLQLMAQAGLAQHSRVIDVGGGASTLVDDLLQRGVNHLTVLDISGRALAASKLRLGNRAAEIAWIEADITQAKLPDNAYDIWHDRAVFHFLIAAKDRQRYLGAMRASLKSGGQAIMATFSLQGPPRCSGLSVARYSPEMLQRELGNDFALAEAVEEEHRTPFGAIQQFVYCRFRLLAGDSGARNPP